MKAAQELVRPKVSWANVSFHPTLQRKCGCGKPIAAGTKCADCRKKRQTLAEGAILQSKLTVNQPGDRFEQEADRMAEFVVGSGARPEPAALSAVSGGAIQREDKAVPPKPNNYDEAVKKILAALAETPAAQALKAKAAELGKDFLSSVEGKVIAGSALGGALAAIIASNSELPMQIPELPLDLISPGLKAKLTWEGPVQKPTSVGLTLTSGKGNSVSATYSSTPSPDGKPAEQKGGLSLTIPLGGSSAKKPGAPTESEKFRGETARISADQAKFREGMKSDKERAEDKAFLDSYLRSKVSDPLNLLGLKKRDDLLMRKEASAEAASDFAPPIVQKTLSGAGQPLDSSTRGFMEKRFGYDFGAVRIFADARAADSARAVKAHAYTVGSRVAFDTGRYSPGTREGLRLLVHELAHVVQQDTIRSLGPVSPPSLQRQVTDPLEQIEGVTDESVHTIVIDPSSGRTRFYARGGKTIDGHVVSLVSSFKPGEYRLEKANSKNVLRTWNIFNSDGSIYRGGLEFSVVLKNADFDRIGYTPTVILRVTAGVLPQLIDLDQRVAAIKTEVSKKLVNDDEELAIIRLLGDIPPEQTAAFVAKLRAEIVGTVPLLEQLDRDIDGENNTLLHQALSKLKLQAGGLKTAAAFADAPSLAWHDVMGFFEQKAVFSVTPIANGKFRIRYIGGISSGLYSQPDYAEIKNLSRKERLNIMTNDGIEVDADQPIIVHDYDNDRQIVLTAEDLITYQHAGVRKFLQDISTIASLATPAGAETVGGRVLAHGVQIASVANLIVDENKLNIRKWFPRWGPAIIEASEKVKMAVAIVGAAQLVQGGWKLFTNLRQLRNARTAMDPKAITTTADELLLAEKQAAQLEARADELLNQAELARKELGLPEAAETSVAHAAERGADTSQDARKAFPPGSNGAGLPEASVGGRGPKPLPNSKSLVEEVTEETRTLFAHHPELKQALEGAPRAARALKKCASPCFPPFASRSQIDRLDRMLATAETSNIAYDEERLTAFLRSKTSWQELESALEELDKELLRKREVLGEFGEAGKQAGRDRTTPRGSPATSAARAQPGEGIGGENLPEISGQWFPNRRDPTTGRAIPDTTDIRVAQIPGQIARKLRSMNFKNFDDFRGTFWMAIARDPALKLGWSPANLKRMEHGLAPVVAGSQATGGGANRVYQLNHKLAIKNAGDVYNLDNIEVVAPKFHGLIGD